LVVVDGDIVCGGDDCDVIFPRGFKVRKYRNDLSYTVHNVVRYPTTNMYTFVYCMMKSPKKVTVRVNSEEIVAMNDSLYDYKYIHFERNTPVDKLVCQMLTDSESLVVLEDISNTPEPTLF
jgi:hypothetical protein